MKLTEFLRSNLGGNISFSAWPSKLNLPSERGGFLGMNSKSKFWHQVKDLRDFTDKGSTSFSKEYVGSTGWEYGAGMVLFWDDLYFSDVFTSRNYTEVNSSVSVNVKTQKKDDGLVDELFINDKKVATKTFNQPKAVERTELINDKKYPLQIAGIVHTHPKIKAPGLDTDFYSFFSVIDIHSWITTGLPLTALVTDRLWLLGMTKEFKLHHAHNLHMLSRRLNDVSRAELKSVDSLYEAASEWASSLELVLYVAEFDGELFRL